MVTQMPLGEVIGSAQGNGSKVGWYIGEEDGLPRRLPTSATARDRYTRRRGRGQRLIWIEDAGEYDLSGTVVPVPGMTNIVRTVPLPDKYTQLNALCEERNPDGSPRFPELIEARRRLYSGDRSRVTKTFPCACGLTFSVEQVYRLHKEGCTAATGASPPSPSSSPAQVPADDAPVAKPRTPVSCRACGEQFATLPEHNRHKAAAHPRKRS